MSEQNDGRQNTNLASLTAEIVAAYCRHNAVAVSDIPAVIQSVYQTLFAPSGILRDAASPIPAVSIKMSVQPTYVVCLECGARQKMLRRHLMTAHNLEAAAYRTKWNLPRSYTLVAPQYGKRRAEIAKQIGLGRRSSQPSRSAGARTAPPRKHRRKSKKAV